MNSRMKKTSINIGVYNLADYARTEKHIRELAECGIDFVIGIENVPSTLHLFKKYEVGAIVSGVVPHWAGGFGKNAGTLEKRHPLQEYVEAMQIFKNHPAIWGIELCDEPSALDFPYLGDVAKVIEEKLNDQFVYMSLYPNYGVVAENSESEAVRQLGAQTYKEYIDKYCAYISSDFICHDFYVYSSSVEKAYEDMQIVSDACAKNKKQMWMVLQVNSSKLEIWLSENNLRFQVYTAMAFGAESIIWACYTAGWWHNQVLDEKGNQTQQYEKLKKVNTEIHLLGQEFIKYHHEKTYILDSEMKNCSIGDFKNIHTENGEHLVIGQMSLKDEGNRSALMISAADDPYDENEKQYNIIFEVACKNVTAFSGKGECPVKRIGQNTYAIEVTSNMGVLLVANHE